MKKLKIKSLLLPALLLSASSLFAQQKAMTYESWLDSVQSKHYVAWEVMLDDLEIRNGEGAESSSEGHYREHNSNNIDQLLHCLPGIHTMRRGNFAGEALLRGLSSDRYVVSVEGMRMFGACTDKMDPVSSYVEPINLKSIDISFGAQNNAMGAGTGGGLNFNLRKPVFTSDQPWSASAEGIYNSVSNGFDQSADVNYSGEKVAFRLSGVHRKGANYRNGDGQEVQYSQYEKWNYIASLLYRVKNDHLLSIDFLGDDANDIGYPALPMDVAYAKAKMVGISYLFPSLAYLKDPEIKIYHNFVKHAMDDTQRDSVAMHMDMPGNTRTTGAFLKGILIAATNQQLEVKIDWFRTFAHAEMTMYPNDAEEAEMFMLTWPDVHRSSGSVNLNYRHALGKDGSVVSGIRLENASSFIASEFGEQQLSVFDKSGSDKRSEWLQNYHINLVWEVTQKFRTTFKVAYGERVPTISEQYGYYLFNRLDNYDYLGDPDLKKESNLHLEVTSEVKTDELALSAAVFAYRFRNYIMGVYQPQYQAMTPGAEGIKFYENTEKAVMAGGELSALYRLGLKSSTLLTMKYVYGEDYEGDPLPQMPPLKVNGVFNQQVLGFSILPEVEWSAAQRRSSQKFNERTTSAYWLCNLRLKKEWESLQVFSPTTAINLELSGGIENLFDTAYREHFDIGNVLRPGRNFYLQVKVGI